MLNVQQVQAASDALSAALLAKGKIRPTASVDIIALRWPRVSLTWVKSGDRDAYEREYKFFDATSLEGLPGAIDAANGFIASMQSKEDEQRATFLRKVADAADYGKSIGIDHALIAPLAATIKAISENAITHQPLRAAE